MERLRRRARHQLHVTVELQFPHPAEPHHFIRAEGIRLSLQPQLDSRFPGHPRLVLEEALVDRPQALDVQLPEGDPLPPHPAPGRGGGQVQDHPRHLPVEETGPVQDLARVCLGAEEIPAPGGDVIPGSDGGKALVVDSEEGADPPPEVAPVLRPPVFRLA